MIDPKGFLKLRADWCPVTWRVDQIAIRVVLENGHGVLIAGDRQRLPLRNGIAMSRGILKCGDHIGKGGSLLRQALIRAVARRKGNKPRTEKPKRLERRKICRLFDRYGRFAVYEQFRDEVDALLGA